MATFAILFVGFMFTFMIEFRMEPPFRNVWLSFTKVIVMTSEIEYSDMFETPVEKGLVWSLVARFILLSFVVLITIVLMNLMVGLAVNDITLLEAQGRTRRLAKQVCHENKLNYYIFYQPISLFNTTFHGSLPFPTIWRVTSLPIQFFQNFLSIYYQKQ